MGETHLNKKQIFTDLAVIFLSNLLPILGVAFFDWKISDIVLLFFFETFVIGIFNILKMLFAATYETPFLFKFIMPPFFLIHYNFFLLIQGIFIIILIVLPDLFGIENLTMQEEEEIPIEEFEAILL